MGESTSTSGRAIGYAEAVALTVPTIVSALRARGSVRLYRETIALMERPLLDHVLKLVDGNQLRAARLLGVNRNTLRKRCRELGLAPIRARRAPATVLVTPVGVTSTVGGSDAGRQARGHGLQPEQRGDQDEQERRIE